MNLEREFLKHILELKKLQDNLDKAQAIEDLLPILEEMTRLTKKAVEISKLLDEEIENENKSI